MSCFFALASHSAFAQNKVAVNALPTGGQVVAGSATISSSQTATSATMNINQTSQRAVINWNTFNVGKNATVNFNQPNSSAVTLNRVTSATPSMIEGAVKANGQVILVNPNGVNFGKGAEVHAAGVVASTLDINNKDFMEGRNTFAGNGQGKIVNEGKIVATDPNGYIALLAPEVRNEGYLLARKGSGSTIAIASGEKITLDFRGTQLIRVSVDVATYKGLIENKRVIETNGGLVVLAAGTARDLMSSLIQNTGRISANAIVDNGGVIDIVASTVNQAGTVSANGKGANSTGGQINIVGENITLAANSKTTATGQAGGGAIQIGVGQTAATNTPAIASTNVTNAANTKNAAPAQTATQILASNPQAANQQAKTVTVEEGASVNTSAVTQGNGGSIVIWSQVKTVVNGVLSAVGGYLNGNGGLVETSSAGTVVLGKNLSVTTAAPKGKSGLWFLDPIDLTIDSSVANVISAALTNNSVSIAVNGNVCPSLGSCTQNGTGSLTIASGANILKESGNLTTLTLTSTGIFNLNADISGQNLNLIINSSIAYLNVGTTINANQVTVQAQTVYSYGTINAGNSSNLGSAIQLLASAIYVSGGLQVGANLANSSNSNSSSNTISYNGTLIRREDLPNYLAAANQTSVNLDQVYSTTAANQSSYTSTAVNQITLTGTDSITISATAQILANGTFGGSISASAAQINLLAPSQNSAQSAQGSGSLIQANGNNGPGGTIALTAANDFNINSVTITANGSTDGGSIRLITSAGNLLLSNSLIQTNGGTGRGGSLGVSAANDTTINSSTLEATGFTKGGSIMVGYDSAGKSIPFSQSTTIDASTILNANQTDGTNSTDGGLIETSGGTLVQLASINAGRGGMWLLDPYDYVVDSTQAGYFNMALNNGFSVSLNTLNPTYSDAGYTISISGKSGTGIIYINSDISSSSALSASASLTFTADTIRIGANISTQGSQTYNGNVVVLGAVRLITNGADLTITGTVSGGYVANQVLMLLGNGGYSILNNGTVILAGNLIAEAAPIPITGGTLSYSSLLNQYVWTPTYSSISSALVVGGGGAGGSYFGGGGGGGQVISSNALSLSAGTSYQISVGSGGVGFYSSGGGGGGTSSVDLYGSVNTHIISASGGNGGSGYSGPGGYGGDGSSGGAPGDGVNGGGGGGGNASNGNPVSGSYAGSGGFGVISSITGYQAYFGVGGGGGAAYGGTPGGSSQVVLNSPGSPQAGTVGGNLTDGKGGVYTSAGCGGPCNGHYAMPNSGSGGGGGGGNGSTGGNGANGVVILHTVADITNFLTINTGGGRLSLLGAVNGSGTNGSTLSVVSISSSNQGNVITGAIKGAISLNYDGLNGSNASLLLSGANTYLGMTTVLSGTLQAGSTTAFGDSNSPILVRNGATLDLYGQTITTGNTLEINGTGFGQRGALINSNQSTPADFGGAITIASNSMIRFGTLNLTGVLTASNNAGLIFTNGVNVTANNLLNYVPLIAGQNAGSISLVSNSGIEVGAVGLWSGFYGTGSLSLAALKGSVVASNDITATSVSLAGTGGLTGIEISSSVSVIATNGAINLIGIGGSVQRYDQPAAWRYGVVLRSGAKLQAYSAQNGDISIYGTNISSNEGYGVSLQGGNQIIDAGRKLTIAGFANGEVYVSVYGFSSTGGVLLKSGGDMVLAGATPNGNSTNSVSSAAYAIYLGDTAVSAAGSLSIEGAVTYTLNSSGYGIGNVVREADGTAANGGSQFGVYIANGATMSYGGKTYSNITAGQNIWIAGSGGGASFAYHGITLGASLSAAGSISLIGSSSGNQADGIFLTGGALIKTASQTYGDISLSGNNSNSASGIGIYLDTGVIVDAAANLTLVGRATGSYGGGVFGIASKNNGGTLLKSGADMVLAASAPNATQGSTSLMSTGGAAIDIHTVINAGRDLNIYGATSTTLSNQNGAIGSSVYNVAIADPTSPAQSLNGVAIENYAGVSFGNSSYVNTVAGRNISINASGSQIGLYVGGSITSNNGYIHLNGLSTDGGSGVAVIVTYSEPKQIITQSAANGDILIAGTSIGSANGYGINLISNGPNPIEINSAKTLSLVGWAGGTGNNYGIKTSGAGKLISGSDMVLAASAPNSQNGSAILTTYNISAGGDLTVEGSTRDGGANYHANAEHQSSGVSLSVLDPRGSSNSVSSAGNIYIYGASVTSMTGDLTASDGHSHNYGVDVGFANLRANGSITIQGNGLSLGANGGTGEFGNVAIVVGNINSGGLLALTGNSPDYSVFGGMTITSAGGIVINGTGYLDLRGSWSNTGSSNTGVVMAVTKDVNFDSLTNSGSNGIRITAGNGLLAGNGTGWTIGRIGSITNTGGVIGLSMATPSTGYGVEALLGITESNASTAQNISYNKASGNFSTPNGYSTGYTNGNFINYRQAFSASYNVAVNNSYSAVYGTTTTSDYARSWLGTNSNVSLSIVGTAFGVNQQAALQSLRFNNVDNGGPNLNIVQNATAITQGVIFSIDGTAVNVLTNTRTYTITPAPLGVTVTGVYNNSTTFAPSSFTTYGLVNGEVISTLSSATVAFKDVLAGNNYVTGLVIGTGTASMSNYQLNPLGRVTTPNSTLQNMVTITPREVQVTGASAASKVYDGTTTAVVNIGTTINGKISGDDLTVTMTSGSFMSPGVGTGISVSGSGSLQGASASNYTLGATLLSANITQAPLGVIVVGTYSNSTTITPTSFTTNGLVNGETITTLTSAIVNNKNVSENGANYVTAITKGNGTATLSNYAITSAYNTTTGNTQNIATINPKTLTVSGTAVADKVYDGTANAVLTNGVLNGVSVGDSVTLTQAGTFSRAGVGTSLTVTAADTISDTSGNYLLQQPQTLTASITPKSLTVSGTIINNKVYDGTANASLSGGSLVGLVAGDSANVTLNPSGTFAGANAGNGIAVAIHDTITGPAAGNYTLVQPAGSPANITPAPLGISVGGAYNGSNFFNNPNFGTTGLVNGETITSLSYVQFSSPNVSANGSNYVTSLTIGSGTATLSNYSVTASYNGSAGTSQMNYVTLSPKALTVSGTSVYGKTYDGTTVASLNPGTLVGIINSDNVSILSNAGTFSSFNAGNNISVASNLTLGGSAAPNYSLTQPTGLIGTITPKALTVTGTTVPDKVYNGSTATTLANGVLVGVVDKDIGSVTLNQSGTFASPNAGSNVAVVANDSLSLTAGAVGNYTLVQPTTTTGNITPKALTVTGTSVVNKVYDGTTDATLTGGTLVGVVAGDQANVTLTQAGTFAQANAGGAIYVTPSDSITGSKASNYTLSQPTGLGADITPKPLGITITGAYNGTNNISVTSFTTSGLVTGEVLGSILSATVSDANVATASKYVSSIAYITGNGVRPLWMSNYSISQAYNPTLGSTQNIATITPIALTVTGTTVPNKVYDGSTATTLANGSLVGVINGETVGLVQAGTFASPNAGNNVAVVANDSLSGNATVLSNYTLIQPTTTTGNITPAPVTVTGTSVANKIYDGTNTAALTGGALSGVIAGDLLNVILNQSGTFASVNVGNAIAVTATDSLTGTKALNYVITQPIVSAANITAKNLTVSGTTVSGKTYDGTNTATLLTGVLVGVVGSENVTLTQAGTFTSINAGTGIAVNAGDSISGPAASNYTLSQPTGLIGTITPKALTVTGTTVPDKVYDGSTTTTLANGVLVGVVAKDVSSVTLNQSGTFASPNAGTNVAVVANDSLSLTAGAVGNYTLTQPTTTTGNIIRKTLTVNNTTVADKTYDGTTVATLTSGTLVGLVTADIPSVSLVQAGTFASANSGSSNVTANDTLTGSKAANYLLTQPTGLSAFILQAPLGISVTATYNGTTSVTPISFTTTGLVNGETIGSLSNVGVVNMNVSANSTNYVSAITIGSGTASMSNYVLNPARSTSNDSYRNNVTINPKALTVTGTSVPDKVYDGSTTTTLANGLLVGVIDKDVGSVTLNQSGTFASPNAGTNVAVVANDSLSLTAGAVGNYTLTQPTTTTGNIIKAPLGVTVNGIYSGGVLAPTAFTTNGLLNGETITALSSATPHDPNVATTSNYVSAITISGGTASMNNYALTQAYNASVGNTQNTVTITPKAVTLTGTKVYDGTLTGAVNGGTLTIGGLVGSQTLNYSGVTVNDANVGTNKYITAITLADGSLGGIASNYALPSLAAASSNNTATITPAPLGITASAVYNGTTFFLNPSAFTTTGLMNGETITVLSSVTLNNANVASNGSNYVASAYILTGTASLSNYSLTNRYNISSGSTQNSAVITPAPVTVNGTNIANKVYDGSVVAGLTGGTLSGVIAADIALVSLNQSGNFASANIGTGIAVIATDSLSGTKATNYALTQPTALSANITAKNLTVTGTTVSAKTYDGTNVATLLTGNLVGVVNGESVTLTQAGIFSSANAGVGLVVTASDVIGGAAAANYTLTQPTGLTGTINPKALTVTSVTASNKVYDGLTSVTFSNAAGLVGVIGSDNVILAQAGSFASKNVGTGIAVTTNNTISGTAAANYTLVQPTGITANITPAPLGVTVTGVYSGSTTVTPTSFTTTGLQGSDTITALSSANFSNANVSANSSNYVTAVTIGSGTASMSNYAITQAYNATVGNTQNTATVTPKVVTLTGTKVYDGTLDQATNGGTLTIGGLIGSQTLNYSNATVSDANVTTANKYFTAVTLADGTYGGIASNYSLPSLSAASASNSATITPLMVRLSANKEYDGTTSMTGKVTISGLVGNETLNYTGATAVSPNVGSNYINAITLTNGTNGGLASNYQTPNLTLAYTNNNAQVTAKSISISATKVYDATTDLTNAITITGLVGNQTLNYSGATANSANVLGASYINAITFADGANGGLERNYIVPALTGANTNNRATITPAPLSLSGTKTYDGGTTGGNGTLNIGGLIGAQTLVSSNVTVNDPNVGTDKFVTVITLADGSLGGIASNYALPNLTAASNRNNGSITPKDLTITVSAQTKTYGDGIAQTSNTQDGSIRVGTTITPTGAASNVDTRNTTTLAQIQYVNYTGNAANGSTAGFSVDGLVANDAVRTVNISSTGGALTANASVNGVSTYAITASGAVGTGLSNYNINYVTNNYSVLTVTPRPLTIRVNNATMAYGAPVLPNFSATVTGQVNGDQANVTLSTTATAYANGVAGSNTGSYDITPVAVNNPNYYVPTDLAHVTKGSLTVTPVNLTITAGDQGGPGSPILYGTPTVLDQSRNALTSVGLTNGDYILGATITYNGSQTISGVTPAGTYNGGLQISSATGTGLTNYNISYAPGNLTIGRAVLTVTAANDAKLQGQADAVNSNYNGVIFSGFKNGENVGTVDLTGLTITRTNSTIDAVGTYTGVLQVAGVTSTNYSIAYGLGNYTIVGPGQLLIKVAPALTQYGTQAVYANPTAAYIPATVTNPTANSAVTLTASMYAPGVIMVTDGTSSMNVNFSVANAVNSSSGNLAVGAYGLDSRVQPATSAGFASQFTSTVTVGGLTVTPKVLTFADFGVSGVSKVYDGSTSMSNIGFAPATTVFIQRDMVNPVANGSFADRNVGANKGYTVGVTFAGTDAANYAMSGGAIYTADGANLTNHGPANGTITQLNSVTYVGAATGGAWSDPASWRVTNGATTGAIPDLANVANIVVNAGNTVVYDPGVIGPVQANLANAGNVNFATNTTLAISMNISGAGSITISGTGQVSLSGNNTYTGNSIINNGARLIAVSGNSVGAGNIQGLGGTFQGTPGAVFAQINATGSLILASDITTTGNQTYGNVTVSQPRTTLLSQNGSITFNGTVDSSAANANTLLVQAPTGTVSFRGSVGSIAPINVLEVDAVSTYLYADVLTSDQQNYCGAGGCYTALTLPQVTANYCAQNDCYSKNNDTSAYNLLATGTGGSGNFAKNPNLGQVFIGDNGQVGFLFNTYNSYATSAFGATAPLLNNNPVFARTLISRDPMVNFGSYISDASANATHTMQVAAIQVPGVAAAPTVQLNGSGSSQAQGTYHSALFSLNALTQSVAATNSLAGSIKNAANSTLETFKSIALGSSSIGLNGVSLATQNLSLAYPPSNPPNPQSVRADTATVNGRATNRIGNTTVTSYTPAAPNNSGARPVTAVSSSRNSFIMSSVSQQTKLDRKYAVEASVDVGEIEMDDRPADKEKDEEERKKKKGGKTT